LHDAPWVHEETLFLQVHTKIGTAHVRNTYGAWDFVVVDIVPFFTPVVTEVFAHGTTKLCVRGFCGVGGRRIKETTGTPRKKGEKKY
jgi:hypothetical protein